MHAERVDGYNPLAVIDAIGRKKKILEEKNGPVLLDTVTYRSRATPPLTPRATGKSRKWMPGASRIRWSPSPRNW